MADLGVDLRRKPRRGKRPGWLTRLAANPAFQSWAARFPMTRGFVRKEGEAMFDLVAGFCHSQLLSAFVQLEIPELLLEAERDVAELARACAVPRARMEVLVNGVAALGLVRRRANGTIALTSRGAALAVVPGLEQMIIHHEVLYRDLADPVAFFRGETETELASFWPYVFGVEGVADTETAETYSRLMADSQSLVAGDTLPHLPLAEFRHLMDIGGGTGVFLAAAGQAAPHLELTLFDLPAVVAPARERFRAEGLEDRAHVVAGSFRDDPLPRGADAISLVRVLYDHSDDTVRALLAKVRDALPEGGRLVISEPMTGGPRPERPGDAYFALYCLAMRTGRARSADEIAALLEEAGFRDIRLPRPARAFVTRVITAVR